MKCYKMLIMDSIKIYRLENRMCQQELAENLVFLLQLLTAYYNCEGNQKKRIKVKYG